MSSIVIDAAPIIDAVLAHSAEQAAVSFSRSAWSGSAVGVFDPQAAKVRQRVLTRMPFTP